MDGTRVAGNVLACLGGADNVRDSALCMTRLRISLANPALVDGEALCGTSGVLGCFGLGSNDIEVVLGPLGAGGMYDAFSSMTGMRIRHHHAIATHMHASNFRIQVAPTHRARDDAKASFDGERQGPADHADDSDAALLSRLAATLESDAAFPVRHDAAKRDLDGDGGRRVLVLNGPNINLLGLREPDVYGTESFDALVTLAKRTAAEEGFVLCRCFQSNHEGDLVDAIQSAHGSFDGIVINPGAYTHTSVALLDALKGVRIPAVEVHISDVSTREDFRQVSYVRSACIGTIMGHGIAGYGEAIRMLATHLGMHVPADDEGPATRH